MKPAEVKARMAALEREWKRAIADCSRAETREQKAACRDRWSRAQRAWARLYQAQRGEP